MDEKAHTHKHHDPSEGSQHNPHTHTHGAVDPALLTSERGIWAIKWSFVGLFSTALLQLFVVFVSGSVALLADTIHNFGDASTSIPLWVAFVLARRKPSRRFTYGYGRVEDLAGVVIVLTILASAVVAGYQSIARLLEPEPIDRIAAVAGAAVIGFVGNEWVARFRIKVGNEINSAALVADGQHARVDGLTSLGVLVSAGGVWLGYPLADPLVGLAITLAILRIVWASGKSVFARLLDGVDPEVVAEIQHAVQHTRGVIAVSDVRVRWLGHLLHAEINLAVDPALTISEAHGIAMNARHDILHHLPYLSNAVIHVDPKDESGEAFHRIEGHVHGDFESHGHH